MLGVKEGPVLQLVGLLGELSEINKLNKLPHPKEKEPLYINVYKMYGSRYALDLDEKAPPIYRKLREGLLSGHKVVLDFSGIDGDGGLYEETVCKLYEEFPVDRVECDVEVTGLENAGDEALLDRARHYAKMEIYKPKLFAQCMKIQYESTGDIDKLTEDEKIWLKYED
jgi:hypothetical protein